MSETRYAIHDSKSLVPLFDKLWENDNLTTLDNSFEETTLTIPNLSDYNMFIVYFLTSDTNIDSCNMYIPGMSHSQMAYYHVQYSNPTRSSTNYFYRRFSINNKSSNEVWFDNGHSMYNGNDVISNSALVPVAILGTKI